MKIKDLQRIIKRNSPVRALFPASDGRLTVRITADDIYSDINPMLPSPSVIDYLFTIAGRVPIGEKLRIEFSGSVDSEKAGRIYTSYIAIELNKCLKELRSLSWKVFSFFAAGAAILTVSYFLEGFARRVITDSVNIIGGFSIWEAADTFVFARAEKRREVLSMLKLYDAVWCSEEKPL